ncbi:hypothetical protein R1flu_016686 [Riccia fluitans]|uniref:Uncharacterized protein n=1 Tax=Riccia fluitans TaxID=41844 RepID=A0ABD1YMP9_9MARC
MSENTSESTAAECSSQGKEAPVRRRSVQFEDSPLELGVRSEPTLQDHKLPTRRSSVLKKSGGGLEKTTSYENNLETPPLVVVENLKKDDSVSNPAKEAGIETEVDGTSIFGVVVPGDEVEYTKTLVDSTLQASFPKKQHNEELDAQSTYARVDSHDGAESSGGLETPRSDSEQEQQEDKEISESLQPSLLHGAVENVEANSLGYDDEGETGGKTSRRGSKAGRKKSKKKSFVFKEIIGSIEKKKGPNLPEKLGFGSSEDRKVLMVESLKEKRKSSILTVSKEQEETSKPLERRRSVGQGLGFGSSERRKTLFDKDDPAKPKERKKSSLNNKEDEKDSTAVGNSQRTSVAMGTRETSSKQFAILALIPQELRQKVAEVAQQEINQLSRKQQEAESLQYTTESDPMKSPSQEEPVQAIGTEMEGVIEVVRNISAAEDSDSSGSEPRIREKAPSIYSSDPTLSNQYVLGAPSLNAIPLDDNEGLTSTLLAGKVHEPLRNELEGWLSSAINRVNNNLSSSWGDPVLRQYKSSARDHSIPPARTPKNTMVVTQPPELSCSTSPSKGTTRGRRLSTLSLGILAGTISDENKVLQQPQQQQQQVVDCAMTPRQQVQGSRVAAKQIVTPRLAPKVLSTPRMGEESSSDQETTEEGLRRLQKEVEYRAWSQYCTKNSPRLILPHSLKKRKMPGESSAFSDYLHENKSSPRLAQDKILNKDLFCTYGGTEHPEKLRNAGLSSLNIIGVEQSDLEMFQNLQYLDLSVNRVNMVRAAKEKSSHQVRKNITNIT